jgi:ribosomal 50S subunit-recycling heat shock protein
MRLDKFLKVSRLIKRRTLAKEVSDQGRITVNGTVAKASSIVKIENLQDSSKKEDAAGMYSLVKEEKISEE